MSQNLDELTDYELGKTTLFACQLDPRFSYYAYIPSKYEEKQIQSSLVVLIHGTSRPAQQYRDEFVDFAEKTNSIILVPVFPAGIVEPGELSSYKFLRYGGVRYDEILLSMI